MVVLIFLLVLIPFFGSNSFGQAYKYVDKNGTICFTDNPPPSLSEKEASNQEPKPKEGINQRKRSRSEIKDIMQIGHEALQKELAKPPEKQNRRLIQEMTEILYGPGSSEKSK